MVSGNGKGKIKNENENVISMQMWDREVDGGQNQAIGPDRELI